MNDQNKTKKQLVAELTEMRRRVAELEASENERGRAEQTLLHAKQEWERTFDSVPDLIAILDNNYRILRVNQSMADRLGLTPEQCIGQICYEAIHGLSQPPTFCPYTRTLADRQGHAVEVYEERLGGDFLVTTTPLFDEREQMVGSVHVARDITKRKQAEEALRKSEDKYKTLVETSPDAVIMSTLEGQITFASQRTLGLLGYERIEDLLGRSPLDLLAEEEHEKFMANFRGQDDLRDVPYTFRRKDGTEFAGEISCAVVQDASGKPVARVALARDITKRKHTQEALRQSNEELQAIYGGMFDGIMVVDIETKRFVRSNPALGRMLGYSEKELLSLSVKDIHRPEDLPNVLEQFQAQAEGRLIVAESIPVLRKNGNLFYADITTTAIDYHGRRCNIGVFHDITARKKAEESLRREYRVLRQMLKAQDRERQLVAYEIHDSLAQYLTGATMQFGAYEKLQKEDPHQASHCYSAGLHLLRESVAEARRLIAGLRPPILDEAGIVAAIAHLIHDVMAQDGPAVEFHSSVKFKRLEPLLENAIFRIVQESLTNVCRHGKSETAEIMLVQDGDRVRIEVLDRGIGFDPDSVEEGCFGLAGIRERARVLGGIAAIESTPGQGTRVVVELPINLSEDDLP